MTPLDAAQPATLTIDLNHAVLALSDALDFTGIDEIGHGHRVALMAANCARALGWDDAAIHRITLAGLLHDCGVSSTREHRHLLNDIVWEGEHAHCERGFAFLGAVPPLAHLAPMVLEHHTPWRELEHRGVVAEVALPANLICLCDRADAVRTRGVPEGKPVIEVLDRYADKHFSPVLMAVFREEARREAFWFVQEDPVLRDTIAQLVGHGPSITLGMAEIKALATMFGRIIDAKSPFTERHSMGVAKVARHLAERFGATGEVLDMVEIAGLLHDLGKLRIPDELLEKHGPLTADERRRMARHAFDTYQVLHRVFGGGPIAQWAAFHHEYVSGQGYPFRLEGEELPREARIIAVADVLQALAQKRPYRQSLATDEIAAILDGMVFGGKLDRAVVEVVKADLPLYWRDAVANEDMDGTV